MDHLHIFNLMADLTKAYDESLYLSANLFKSPKESYSEDRAAFAFKNSFGKDVPGVAAGTTYDEEDKEKANKKEESEDLDKAITGWDVAEAALWFTPVGRVAQGAKALNKLASVGFKSKRLMDPIRKLYGAKAAKDYSVAATKGARHAAKFLEGLANSKPMKQLSSFADDAVKFVQSASAGKFGSSGVKAANDYLKFAGTKAGRSHGVLSRTSEMTRQGLKITPTQKVITNLELSAAGGSRSALFRGTPLARYAAGSARATTRGARAGKGHSSLRRYESYRKAKRGGGRGRKVPKVAAILAAHTKGGGKSTASRVGPKGLGSDAESPSLYLKGAGSGKGGVAGASVKGKGPKLIVSAGKGKAPKAGGRYRYSGERPETWKEVHAEAKERA